MSSPGANLEHLLTRTTTLTVVLQGVLVQLDALDPTAAGRIKQFALDLAADLKAHAATGPQIGGDRLEADIQSFFGAIQPGPPGG